MTNSTDQGQNDICPTCKGTTWIFTEDENGYEICSRCKCFTSITAANRLSFANIPKAYKGMKLTNFLHDVYKSNESRKLITIVKKSVDCYLDNFDQLSSQGQGLYIHSNTKGSGKTRMAASIANELVDKGVRTKFATSTTIIAEIKKSWSKENSYSESRLIEDLISVQILIIDDFGTEKVQDWMNEKFYQIINERYINKKPTIYTSNHSLQELTYNERIISRIEERSFLIPFPEESIRGHIAKENNLTMIEMLRNSTSA